MEIKKGYSCGLRITLTYPNNSKVDIRNSKFLAVSLILPDKTVKPIKDVGFDEVTGTIFVRLSGGNDLNTIGKYSIHVNVQDKDTRMLSTVKTPVFNVTDRAYEGYKSIVLSLALYSVETPGNVSITGASPQVSPLQTWLVYDDTLKSYIDTGIQVRGDSAFQTWLQQPGNEDKTYEDFETWLRQPATEAGEKADYAAERANQAADNAYESAIDADKATKRADEATVAAKVATENAKIITGEAQEAIKKTQEATQGLEDVKSECIAATNNANTAAENAQINATNAKNEADAARGAATKAQEAATSANSAATKAQEATQEAKEATREAQEAAQSANNAAGTINNKLDKTGDGKDVTVTFTESSSRGNINSGEKLSVLFGKIKRWFTDLKALAFKDKAGKTDLDTALQNEIDGKYDKVSEVAIENNNEINGTGSVLHFNYRGNSMLVLGYNNQPVVIGVGKHQVWHAGNLIIAPNNSVVASEIGNKIPKYTQSGYLNAVIFRDSWAKDDSLAINEIGFRVSQEDGYHRWCSLARLKTALGSMPANGGNADASKMLSLRPDRPTVGNGLVVNQAADYSDAPIKGNWYTYLRMLHPTQGYFGELASPFSGNNPHPFYRMVVAGVTGQWNKIAFVKDIPDVSGLLPKSGGSLTGRLSTVNVAAMYGEGALRASIMYNGLTPITSGAYHSFLAMKSVEGNTLNFGGIGNNIGFYGFLHDRTENGFDYRFICNTATGNWHLENGGIVLSGSTPEHVLKFRRNGSDKGYIGLGSSTSTDLIVQNAAGNSSLKCADDGKCYANGKEIATVDQLGGSGSGGIDSGWQTWTFPPGCNYVLTGHTPQFRYRNGILYLNGSFYRPASSNNKTVLITGAALAPYGFDPTDVYNKGVYSGVDYLKSTIKITYSGDTEALEIWCEEAGHDFEFFNLAIPLF